MGFKTILIRIYKDLKLTSIESRAHYQENGNLDPSPLRFFFRNCFTALIPKIDTFPV